MLARRLILISTVLCAIALVGCTFGPPSVPTTTTTATTTSTSTTTTTIAPTTSTSTTTTATTTTLPPTTTTTIPLITEGAVAIVSNASGVTGAAALLTQELTALGFHMGDATNTAGVEERLDVSKVYYLPARGGGGAAIRRGGG